MKVSQTTISLVVPVLIPKSNSISVAILFQFNLKSLHDLGLALEASEWLKIVCYHVLLD